METKSFREPMILISTGNSGSSALMHVLSECGLFLGYTKEYKGRNHYEHPLFQQVNKGILGADRYPYPWIEQGRDRADMLDKYDVSHLNSLKYFLLRAMKNEGLQVSQPWGFKDPRCCITFPFWIEVFPKGKYLFLERHPEARQGWNKAGDDGYDYFWNWFIENIALANKLKLDVFYTNYDRVAEELNNILVWLNIDISSADLGKAFAIWQPKPIS